MNPHPPMPPQSFVCPNIRCPLPERKFELVGGPLYRARFKQKNGIVSSGPYCCRKCAGQDSNRKNRELTKVPEYRKRKA